MIFTNVFQQLKSPEKALYFLFWANCILVQGYRRTLVYDIQRERIFHLSNLFFEIFQKNKNKSIHDINNDVSDDNRMGYLKIIDFLIKNDYGILVDDVGTLPSLSTQNEVPFIITNAIINVNSSETELLFEIIRKLVALRIKALRIDDEGQISLEVLNEINKITFSSTIEYISIRSHFSSFYELSEYHLSNRFRRITYYNSPKNDQIERPNNSFVDIRYSVNDIEYLDCGNIGKQHFVNNLLFFTEAQHHNTCLNRKICIDAKGDIKNCPAMKQSYGNISDTTLLEVIEKPGFKDCWTICKDQIDVCKDCEFRYMCTDCRCFIKDPENIYSQPAKCTYNPYICKWDGQEGYVPVEKCGSYSRETGFVPDIEKINALNKLIWGEDD